MVGLSSGATGFGASLHDSPMEAYQTPLERVDRLQELGGRVGVQKAETIDHVDLALDLAGGTDGNAEESRHVSRTGASAAFGDIRRDRDSGRPDLSPEPVSLAGRKVLGRGVYGGGERDAVVPDSKSTEVLHKVSSTIHQRIMEDPRSPDPAISPTTYHLPLRTRRHREGPHR